VLREKGLPAALDWLAQHVADTHNLRLQLDVADDLRVPTEDLRTLLFRSVRELVFNVVKHAGVDTATLRAHPTDEGCMMEVVDEGHGFDPTQVEAANDPEGHFGLFSVRERLDLVGGHLTIDSDPGSGTRARIDVPLPE
jgi:signal transduction histidine kinase